MFKAFTQRGNHRWIDIIKDIEESYNSAYHRSIKMAPNDVNLANEELVRNTLYKPTPAPDKPVFKIGDLVRLSRKDHVFRKGYEETFTFEVFKVAKINKTSPVTYKVTEFNGDPIAGSFYKQELQKIDKTADVWSIEKVINKRKLRDGTHQLRVKWTGYDNSYNSWIDAEDVVVQNRD